MRLGLRLQDDKFLTLSSIVFVLSLSSSPISEQGYDAAEYLYSDMS